MMKQYRYRLDIGSKKVNCFECGKKRAVPFIDTKTNERLPEQYCRCDRESNCTYFLSPYHDGYADAIREQEKGFEFLPSKRFNRVAAIKPQIKPQQAGSIPFEELYQTLNNYGHNAFILALIRILGEEAVTHAIEKYYLGTSNRWPGATTFPFIDYKNNVRAIQVKLFDDTLHTAKYKNKDGDLVPCIGYHEYTVKYKLEKQGQPLPEWLTKYLQNEKKVFCFFGEHLLNLPENKGKIIAIVEAPKTAIIADIYFNEWLGDNNFIWLAVGGLSYLTEERCRVLAGREAVLYPDLNAFDKWNKRAKELSNIASFKVSDLLERKATDEERVKGLDLADYLLRIPLSSAMPAISSEDASIILMKDLQYFPCDTITGNELGNLIMIRVKSGSKYYDVLFDANEELVTERTDEVNRVAEIFKKDFREIMFDEHVCLAHLITN